MKNSLRDLTLNILVIAVFFGYLFSSLCESIWIIILSNFIFLMLLFFASLQLNRVRDDKKWYWIVSEFPGLTNGQIAIFSIVFYALLRGVNILTEKILGESSAINVILILIAITIPFLLYVIKKEGIKSNIIYTFVTLLLVYLGIFSAYNYFEKARLESENRTKFTIGFRAWSSKVTISDIEIEYYDEFDQNDSIKISDIYNQSNWEINLWPQKNSDVYFNKSSIVVKNCGIAIKPDMFEGKPDEFFVKAKILFENILDTNEYHTIQYCLRIPVLKKNKNDEFVYTERYLGYEFFTNNVIFSKLRVPRLDYDFSNETLDYRSHNDVDSIQVNHDINYIVEKIMHCTENNVDSIKNTMSISENEEVILSAMYYNRQCTYKIYNCKNRENKNLFDFNLRNKGAFLVQEQMEW